MATSVEFLHFTTVEGTHYRPGEQATFDDLVAETIVRGYRAFYLNPQPGPIPHPDPYPQYVTDAELAAFEATAGADGKTVLTTTGAPADATGTDGDYAYDPAAKIMYGPRAAGVWPAGVSLAGPAGITVVEHGAVGSTARPSSPVVYWIGTATPANALSYDFWLEA